MDGDGKKPPNAPEIRTIENYWGILKMKVYEGNWTAQTRNHLHNSMHQNEAKGNQSRFCH